jgi:hypothetical protein
MTMKDQKCKKYGLLPIKISESDTVPLFMVCLDLVGPFTIKTPTKKYSLLTLTMTDPVTDWFEIVKTTKKSAPSIQNLFYNTWLARCLQLQFIVFDNVHVDEFKREFKKCVCKMIIELKSNQRQFTIYNPRANAIVERVHKVIDTMIRSFDMEHNHKNLKEYNPFDYFLQSTS